jgi:hypothetical protein
MSRMTLTADPSQSARPSAWFSDLAVLIYLAAATVIVHLLTGGRYGFHRDELATLDDARHLAWGYVAYPPITPFFARVSLTLFGTSLVGFRFFAAIAQAVAVVLTGLMARELGGGRGAQRLPPLRRFRFVWRGVLMQYVLDYLCWVLTAYFVVRCSPARTSAGGCYRLLDRSGDDGEIQHGILALGIVAESCSRMRAAIWPARLCTESLCRCWFSCPIRLAGATPFCLVRFPARYPSRYSHRPQKRISCSGQL